MDNLWRDEDAKSFEHSDLAMRVYTSQLLGLNDDLVLHGGGNTSVKSIATDIFGEEEEILFVKGSGWDLKTIEEPGFSPARLDVPDPAYYSSTGASLSPSRRHQISRYLRYHARTHSR